MEVMVATEEQEMRTGKDLAVTPLAVCPAARPARLAIDKTQRYTLSRVSAYHNTI